MTGFFSMYLLASSRLQISGLPSTVLSTPRKIEEGNFGQKNLREKRNWGRYKFGSAHEAGPIGGDRLKAGHRYAYPSPSIQYSTFSGLSEIQLEAASSSGIPFSMFIITEDISSWVQWNLSAMA